MTSEQYGLQEKFKKYDKPVLIISFRDFFIEWIISLLVAVLREYCARCRNLALMEFNV